MTDLLFELCGQLATESILFSHRAASTLGLNATDTKCIDLVARHPNQPITAGWLAETMGLTTGAVTGILDRLENLRLIERYKDPDDRRKVLVKLGDRCLARLNPHFTSLKSTFRRHMKKFSRSEQETIRRFLEESIHVIRDTTD